MLRRDTDAQRMEGNSGDRGWIYQGEIKKSRVRLGIEGDGKSRRFMFNK